MIANLLAESHLIRSVSKYHVQKLLTNSIVLKFLHQNTLRFHNQLQQERRRHISKYPHFQQIQVHYDFYHFLHQHTRLHHNTRRPSPHHSCYKIIHFMYHHHILLHHSHHLRSSPHLGSMTMNQYFPTHMIIILPHTTRHATLKVPR